MFSRLYSLNLSFECKMSGSWSTEETTTLISTWGEESVQSRLDSAHRNRHIFEQIAREMSDKGYEKTWQQCRTKMKNLIQKYRKIKDHNNVSGNNRENWIYFDQLDAILGTRPSSAPVTLLQSGSSSVIIQSQEIDLDETQVPPDFDETYVEGYTQDEGEGNDGQDLLSTAEVTVSSPTIVPAITTSSPPTTSSTAMPSSSTTATSSRDDTQGKRKGFKKKAKKESLPLELSMALEKLDERADARAEERELKRMQLEAELLDKQRDKEREHEMHMQGMMLSFMQQMMSTLTGRSYGHPSHVHSPTYPLHTSFPDEVPPYPPVTEHPNTSGNN